MKLLARCLGVLATLACSLSFAGPAPATMRVDYYHTGGRGAEVFALDAVRIEPLAWPGHPQRTTDDLGLGNYRYEVRDLQGTLLYSRGYSSIYAEWVTTEEASTSSRTFHESLRFPVPSGPVEVTVLKRGAQQAFAPVWTTRVDPADPTVDRTAPPRQALVKIERHGNPADKVDVLLLGDGYTAGECATKFPRDARRLTDQLFRHEPFAARRQDFNVWGLCPPSAESGISRPSTGIQRRSPVGATYDAFGSDRKSTRLNSSHRL